MIRHSSFVVSNAATPTEKRIYCRCLDLDVFQDVFQYVDVVVSYTQAQFWDKEKKTKLEFLENSRFDLDPSIVIIEQDTFRFAIERTSPILSEYSTFIFVFVAFLCCCS
jgi:hypothetical protein